MCDQFSIASLRVEWCQWNSWLNAACRFEVSKVTNTTRFQSTDVNLQVHHTAPCRWRFYLPLAGRWGICQFRNAHGHWLYVHRYVRMVSWTIWRLNKWTSKVFGPPEQRDCCEHMHSNCYASWSNATGMIDSCLIELDRSMLWVSRWVQENYSLVSHWVTYAGDWIKIGSKKNELDLRAFKWNGISVVPT